MTIRSYFDSLCVDVIGFWSRNLMLARQRIRCDLEPEIHRTDERRTKTVES